MAYNVNQKVTLEQLELLTAKIPPAISAAIADLPKEQFLELLKTEFVGSFAFDATKYPGATNPNLDGKPVEVFAVKQVDHTNNNAQTITYSFLDLSSLLNIYTTKTGATSQVINIAGYEIEFKFDDTLTSSASGLGVAVSAVANNAITKQSDGIHVDISGKSDKVANATAGNLAGLDANGNLTDSGVIAANVLTTADVATDTEVNEMLAKYFSQSKVNRCGADLKVSPVFYGGFYSWLMTQRKN